MSEVAGKNTQFIDLQVQERQIRAAVEEYSILINDWDKVEANLKSKGVPTTIYYPMHAAFTDRILFSWLQER